jgi:hypothetical protein
MFGNRWRGSAVIGPAAGSAAALWLFGATACGGLAIDGPGNGERVVDDGEVGVGTSSEPSSPSRAVASVRVGALSSACPSPIEYMVPDSDAHATLQNGRGVRAVDGPGHDIRCRVAPLPDPDRRFAVDLMYRQVPSDELHVVGELTGGGAAGSVTLQLSSPSTGRIEAECRVNVRQVLSGAIWLEANDCTGVSVDGARVDCDIALGMIFEHCSE